ncbi:serine hydrolase domain-containing protein, partial [Virgisporangium aurantiacum]|uniref:serine hydrolase domain-containing protein n=1 Tax=Virgisporangium aurantiacum TaxID=175570 RepID=UPI00194EEBEE
MTRRSILAAAGAAAGAASVAPVALSGGAAATAPRKDLLAYERFVADRAARDLFSGTILVAHDGRPVLTRAYGLANRDRSIRNRPDTVFWLASITKTFIAVAVMRLVQQGRLRLDDPIGAHLDGFPADAAAATVHHLLTHTSGIGRPPIGPRDPAEEAWASFDEALAGTLAIVRRTPLQFPPGTRHVYSNDGFSVLAAIVATVTGRSYVDHVRENVFVPAGMTSTAFIGRPDVLANDRVARPYWTQPDGSRIDAATSPVMGYTAGPPGGAYSTAADLLAFVRALTSTKTGTLLAPCFVDVMTGGKVPTPLPVDLPAQAQFYGYGHVETILAGTRIVGHSGGGPGVATRLDVFPRSGWTSVVLGNYDTTIAPIVAKARELLTG